ncbi:hypothetical protein Hypma_004950 [Hypsizygus marmoreus]|uniref:Uncharacterized protein n=1 Tax=Hypsizygus marmoreus TaxID=39966 RepID=A0A369K2E5_HYPMA|nr:hypothetical protein Hypma_004950 [Hypsizygus marmoreus]
MSTMMVGQRITTRGVLNCLFKCYITTGGYTTVSTMVSADKHYGIAMIRMRAAYHCSIDEGRCHMSKGVASWPGTSIVRGRRSVTDRNVLQCLACYPILTITISFQGKHNRVYWKMYNQRGGADQITLFEKP